MSETSKLLVATFLPSFVVYSTKLAK